MLKKDAIIKWVRWLPALMMMGSIFLASSTPSSQIPTFGVWDMLAKKGGHFLAYGLLALLYLFGLKASKTRNLFFAVGLVLLYAITDEFHQSFTPGRHPSIVDVGIDTSGALVALAVWYTFFRGQTRSISPKSTG